ncbi:MAG: sortase [Clostridiales bacterium]|nr:sortase [Clostridiales bacterium]
MDRKRRTDKYIAPAAPPSASAAPPREKKAAYSHQVQGYRPEEEKRPKKRKSAIYIIVLAVLSAVFVYASAQLVIYLAHSHQAKQEEQMIQQMIAENETEEAQAAIAEPDTAQTAVPEPGEPTKAPPQPRTFRQAAEKPDVLIQFTKALSLNPDTIGQLKMGESINTYVVQRDNSYYLRHSFSGEYSFSGAIFLDVSCSIYPQSRNLIIHGHNMQDGTAFGKLSRFENIDYLNKYPFIEFSTLYESALYIPFAVVYYSIDTDSEEYLDIYQINMMTVGEFVRFVSKAQMMSEYRIPVYVAGGDKILTITTCTSGNDDMRFAVFAVKKQ